ncbi:MAG: Rab family GTPase [Myxococcota bacterium]
MSPQKKICLLGSFGVGKTSLVARYVHSLFDVKYQTTVGVKVDRKRIRVDGTEIVLMVWDLAGEDEFNSVRTSYLRGSSGYVLVADGTRSETLQTAFDLDSRVQKVLPELPRVLVLNKVDRVRDWEVDSEALRRSSARHEAVVETSAKTGSGVDDAFGLLAEAMMMKRQAWTPRS